MPELAEREHAPGQARPGRPRLVGLPGRLVVAVPALAGFVITVAGLSGASLWRDEAYTKDAISRSLSHLFAVLGETDAVHGAYYVVVHFFAEAFGTSDAALRFPSVCAMAVAAGFTAATGRRAATLAGTRWPDATGLLAGLLFAVAPYTTYYAQMARSYAFVTMFATIASYLLLRATTIAPAAPAASASSALPAGGWRWWCGYGLAVGCAGAFNTFGLLILPAHALTLLVVRGPSARSALPWLIASVAAILVLSPLLLISFHQRGQISWLPRPKAKTIFNLVRDFAGSKSLMAPVGLLALGGVLAGVLDRRRWSPAAIALPWLVVPPGFLLAVSLVKPVYDVRYVEFCLPALAILVAAGLVGLARVLARVLASTPLARADARLAWLPSAVILAVLAVLLIAPQRAIRQSSARPDNLRLAAEIVAANERPGDVVFYLPYNMRVLGTGYPAPFSRLRDLARARSPVASATLTGTEVASPAELARRFTQVNRVWIVTGASNYKFPSPATPLDREKLALVAGMHIVRRWQAGQVMLTLYAR